MRFYNTLTREKETFATLQPGVAAIYSCGPTVYSAAHIGNLRTYIFMDLLRKSLRRNGFALRHVMNITDVGHLTDDADDGEDKMVAEARRRKVSPWEIAAQFTELFLRDIALLNVETPEIVAKATDNIPEMIEYVEKLLQNGHAYETSDGIYFDIATIPNYGVLSRANLDENIAGARVEVNSEKRNAADFAVWKKAAPEHIMQWDSPWGRGFPGWHIECSAMGCKYLGETFDIHTGGVDAIPIHHENEIAQSVGACGKIPAKYWLHGEFMMVDGGKMSKSLGNVYTIDELKTRGFDPLDFRYLCENAHYRSKLNFTFEALTSAKTAINNLRALIKQHKAGTARVDTAAFERQFNEAVEDDLNIPKALGVVWTAAKSERSPDVFEFITRCDTLLSLDLEREPESKDVDVPDEVQAMVDARIAAKKAKNFAEADRIRDELKARGYALLDTPEGTIIQKG